MLGGGYYYFIHQKEAVRVVAGDYLPEVKEAQKMTDKEIKKAEQKAVDASKFNMVIKPEAVFETGDQAGTLYIQNPEHNAYPINVVITIDKTGEEVYSSGALEPGYEIKTAVLGQKLAKGDYPATATFSIYDPKTKQKRGQVQASITIKVLN
ncbi:hypothetical protein [Enterococcus sp. UD-01]|jgi:hypothetical protein|uniref:hypothetical protein n=1 Tax=Enterococcus sp. UD-01 TaxID=3373911 RepID=UPI003837CA57